MRRTGMLATVFLCGTVMVGCDEDAGTETVDGGSAAGGVADAGVVDGGGAPSGAMDAPTMMSKVSAKRGEYLVRTVLGCVDCHTPTKMDGMRVVPDMTKEFQGRPCQTDTLPMEMGKGCINSANLTNHETGIKALSDGELKRIITTGVREGGKKLHAQMPYWVYTLLADDDLASVVQFLRTIPGVDNRIAAHEEPHDKGALDVVTPVKASELPAGAASESSKNGRYLAAIACLACHTPTVNGPAGAAPNRPIDLSKAFVGGRWFGPPMPPTVQSANLTAHETGLKDWTAAQVAKAIKDGVDKEGKKVCPPMPSGPMGLYKDMTDADATDLATYFLSLPPVKSDIVMNCSM